MRPRQARAAVRLLVLRDRSVEERVQMKPVLKAIGAATLLTACVGCDSPYLTNLLGGTGVAVVSEVLSEFFDRLFQQI